MATRHQQQYGWMRTTRITLQTLTLAQPPSPYQTFCTIRSNVRDMKTFTFRSMFFSTFAVVFCKSGAYLWKGKISSTFSMLHCHAMQKCAKSNLSIMMQNCQDELEKVESEEMQIKSMCSLPHLGKYAQIN